MVDHAFVLSSGFDMMTTAELEISRCRLKTVLNNNNSQQLAKRMMCALQLVSVNLFPERLDFAVTFSYTILTDESTFCR